MHFKEKDIINTFIKRYFGLEEMGDTKYHPQSLLLFEENI
jgi:hypothetical protein